jgi:ubiquitin carboxyl-terminal hydrolase 7
MVASSASHLGGKSALASAAAAASPAPFCRALGIRILEQQDSQEFWKLLLPAVNLQSLTDLYQGAFEDYIVALDGSGRERRREEAFLDLSLDVHPTSGGDSSSSSVMDGLQSLFGKPELLSASEGNGWRPEKGADPVDAHKGSTLMAQGLPPVLQLHLKRFQYDWNTDTTRKINDPVSFPLTLDLRDLCQNNKEETSTDSTSTDDDDGSLTYDLQAIVVHAGNDHIVDAVSFSEVYADARGGKAPMESAIQDDENKAPSKRPGWFGRLWGRVGRASCKDPYGYGGRTSNAYVLQYVKRSDVPMLYDT